MGKVDNTLRPIFYLRMDRQPIPEFCVIRMLLFSQTMETAHLEYYDNDDDDDLWWQQQLQSTNNIKFQNHITD